MPFALWKNVATSRCHISEQIYEIPKIGSCFIKKLKIDLHYIKTMNVMALTVPMPNIYGKFIMLGVGAPSGGWRDRFKVR